MSYIADELQVNTCMQLFSYSIIEAVSVQLLGSVRFCDVQLVRLWQARSKTKQRGTFSSSSLLPTWQRNTVIVIIIIIINSIHVCRLNHHSRPVPLKTLSVIEI